MVHRSQGFHWLGAPISGPITGGQDRLEAVIDFTCMRSSLPGPSDYGKEAKGVNEYCKRRHMVERSDRMWSTGEGNGKPLQYSCLQNSMNSMKRQSDRTD